MIIKNMIDAKQAWEWMQLNMFLGEYHISLTESTRLVFRNTGRVFFDDDHCAYMDEIKQTPEKVLWKYRKVWNTGCRFWSSYKH